MAEAFPPEPPVALMVTEVTPAGTVKARVCEAGAACVTPGRPITTEKTTLGARPPRRHQRRAKGAVSVRVRGTTRFDETAFAVGERHQRLVDPARTRARIAARWSRSRASG